MQALSALHVAFEDARVRAIAATEEYEVASRSDPEGRAILSELAIATTQEASLRLKQWLRAERLRERAS